MLGGIGSWRRHGSNGRFAASKPLDVQLKSVVLARFIRTPPRVRSLNFRFADDTPLVEDAPFPWLARDTPFGRNCYIFAEGEFLQQRAQ